MHKIVSILTKQKEAQSDRITREELTKHTRYVPEVKRGLFTSLLRLATTETGPRHFK